MAPPPAGSVTPQQLAQFLNENNIEPWYGSLLSHVPADRWDRISTFMYDNPDHIVEDNIVALTRMPIDSLDTVLTFVREHRTRNGCVISALYRVAATELEAFTTFTERVRGNETIS